MSEAEQPRPKPELSGGVEVAPGVHVGEEAIRIQFSRGSGPGGQNVNKLNTKAELWVPLDAIQGLDEPARGRLSRLAGQRLTGAGEIHLTAQTARSQEGNREAVLERLRQLIVQAMVRPKPRRKTRPTRASQRRRLEAKRRRSQTKLQRRGAAE